MADWRTTLDLQDIFYKRNGECGPEDWTDKTVHELAKEIARRLEKKFAHLLQDDDETDFELWDIVDALKGVETKQQWQKSLDYLTENGEESEFRMVLENTPTQQMDEALVMLYDWADANRVWVNK